MSEKERYYPRHWVKIVKPKPITIDRGKPVKPPKVDPKVTHEMVLEALSKTPSGVEIIKHLEEKGVKLKEGK